MRPPANVAYSLVAGRGASARDRHSLFSLPARRSGVGSLRPFIGEATRQRPMRAGRDATSAPNETPGSRRP
jgi:hypothetical protein